VSAALATWSRWEIAMATRSRSATMRAAPKAARSASARSTGMNLITVDVNA
jgi:hypothetical protein